jgi:hypothetical protein
MLRTFFAAMLLMLLVPLSSAQPRPKWQLNDYPHRALVPAPNLPTEFLLVTIPTETPSNIASFDSNGNRLAHRVVHTNSSEISILIHFPQQEKRIRTCSVYYGSINPITIPMPPPSTPYLPPADPEENSNDPFENLVQDFLENPAPDPETTPSPDEPLRDPRPLALTVYDSPVNNIPTSLEKMLFLFNKTKNINEVSLHSYFGHLRLSEDSPDIRRRGGRRRRRERQQPEQRRIIALSSFVLCPQTGIYRFALDSKDAGFILTDGEVTADWPGEHASGFWQPGTPILLEAGPHQIEAFNCAQRFTETRIGWQPPGQTEITPIPPESLVTASKPRSIRIEDRNRTLQPHFSWEELTPYSFRGNPAVFVPVKFKDQTRNWTNSNVNYSWRFGDAGTATGKNPIHIYSSAKQYTATLTATDSLGAVETCERSLDLRLTRAREFACLSAEITSLPAVCFTHDIIEPNLLFAGAFPDQVSMKITWTVKTLAGKEEEFNESIRASATPVKIPLLKNTAGSLDKVEWRINHHGVLMDSGTILFVTPASPALPTHVKGDRLYDKDNRQLVLVTSNRRDKDHPQPPFTDQIVCLDDMLATPAVITPDNPQTFHRTLSAILTPATVKYVNLPPWDHFPKARGDLLKLTLIPASLNPGTDTAVLSFGLPDIMSATDPDLFEKHVSAICDIVCRSMKCPVILVTPPPYPSNPSRIRPFAVAIRRIAETRNIPVADLYTAFMCSPEQSRLFTTGQNLALSGQGHRLAANVISKTLASGMPGTQTRNAK